MWLEVKDFIVVGDTVKILVKNSFPWSTDLTWKEVEVLEVWRVPWYDWETNEWIWDDIQIGVKDDNCPDWLAWYISDQFELTKRFYYEDDDEE